MRAAAALLIAASTAWSPVLAQEQIPAPAVTTPAAPDTLLESDPARAERPSFGETMPAMTVTEEPAATPPAAPAEDPGLRPASEAAPSETAPADTTSPLTPAQPTPAGTSSGHPFEPSSEQNGDPASAPFSTSLDGSDEEDTTTAPAADVSHLPRDLSPWGMFLAADIVVKAVMIGLAFASVVTWTVWLAKSLELAWAKRRLTRSFATIHASLTLTEAAQRLSRQKGVVSGLIDLAVMELGLSSDVSDKAGIKERVSSRLDGLAAAAGRDMNRGTGVLATIGSTSPFVGLFGTVWGIMNSFIGISEAQTTNLAIVAPGIAEALLATALGLVAAIPAVIIYNHFARQIGGYRAMIAEASAEVMRLVSRDLDRGIKIAQPRAAE
ncbi:tonB-system energizer ExbB [Hyphomicrobium sp.]|uniref:tonB-system energizer ExbB n=1 Tax=Hyphomicrobium sp. TaxID=82 RepID=UPI002FDE08F7